MSDEQVRANGKLYSWSSSILTVGGERYSTFTEITWSGEKRERTLAYGMDRSHAPYARSSGKYIPPQLKFKGPQPAVQALLDQYAALSENQRSYGKVALPIVFQMSEPGMPGITMEFDDCAIEAPNDGGATEGSEILAGEVTFSVIKCRRNGKTLYDSDEELQ